MMKYEKCEQCGRRVDELEEDHVCNILDIEIKRLSARSGRRKRELKRLNERAYVHACHARDAREKVSMAILHESHLRQENRALREQLEEANARIRRLKQPQRVAEPVATGTEGG